MVAAFGRAAPRPADHREDPRHGLLRGPRPAVQPGDRLELLRAGGGGAERLGRRARATSSIAVAAAVLVVAILGADAACGRCGCPGSCHRHRARRSAPSAVLGSPGCSARPFGVQACPARPSPPAARPASPTTRSSRCAPASRTSRAFAKAASRTTRSATHRATSLLTGLRGKDVIFAFVESYGQVAVQGTSFSPQVDTVLDRHETPRRGRVLRPERVPHLTDVRRHQLAGPLDPAVRALGRQPAALQPAGREQPLHPQRRVQAGRLAHRRRRPSNDQPWPEGTSFYHYDKLYDARNVGYAGPKFSYAAMPDQYTLAAFQRNELAKPDRPPVMAEIDLVSSHTPWTPLPHMVAWNQLGDGSVFDPMPARDAPAEASCGASPDRCRRPTGSRSSTR